jgi:hypothetical protein
MRDIPSYSCRPIVIPRLRARSSSLNSPSGFSQSMMCWAYLANSSGRCKPLALYHTKRLATPAQRIMLYAKECAGDALPCKTPGREGRILPKSRHSANFLDAS